MRAKRDSRGGSGSHRCLCRNGLDAHGGGGIRSRKVWGRE